MISKSNKFVFYGLHVIAWIIFIGLCIEAGALTVNFIFSLYKPGVLPNLYQKLDLKEIYDVSELIFFGVFGFILAIAYLKAHMFYIVIRLISKLDLEKPFNHYAARQITNISYYTFSIGIISYIARQTTKNLSQHHGFNIDMLNQFWTDSQAYILMAAIIYVIATIFSRGVEIQTENELTV